MDRAAAYHLFLRSNADRRSAQRFAAEHARRWQREAADRAGEARAARAQLDAHPDALTDTRTRRLQYHARMAASSAASWLERATR